MTTLNRAPRRVLVLGAALTAVTLLSACAGAEDSAPSGGDSTASGSSERSLLPPAEGKTTYPLTLTSEFGETVLEERPERVATITQNGLDAELVAALGGVPAVANENSESNYITDALASPIENVYQIGDVPYPAETILAADPDLIIVLDELTAEDYERLAQIAPVVVGPEDVTTFDWQQSIQDIGEAIDLSDAADKVIADYDAVFENYRSDNPELAGKTSTMAIYYGAEYGLRYLSPSGSDVEAFLLSLGFSPNPTAQHFTDEATVSNELLGELEADVLILTDNSDGSLGDVTDQPLYQSLDVVTEDHVVNILNNVDNFVLDGETHEGNLAWAIARGGPLAAQWALTTLGPAVAAAAAR